MTVSESPPRTLEEVWADQIAFNREVGFREELIADEPAREEWLFRYWRALLDEAGEFIRKCNFKIHRLRRKPLNYPGLYEELIDMQKYLFSLMIACGMTPETFFHEYHRKSEVVRDKWRRELVKLKEDTLIAVFDIDGVLSDYPGAWVKYLNAKLNGSWSYDQLTSYYASECLPIDRNTEERLKEQFRVEELHKLPANDGAAEVLNVLKTRGYTIVLVTGRPYSARTHYDTVSWLAKKGLPYDILVWGEDKADTLYNEIAPAAPAFVVEDKPSTIEKLISTRYVVYVYDQPYNRSVPDSGNVQRISSLADLLGMV